VRIKKRVLFLLNFLFLATIFFVQGYDTMRDIASNVQYDQADLQMILFLQNYIKINTAHPNPKYEQAIQFFQSQAQKDGFETEVVTLESGLPVLVVTLQGTDKTLPALVLNHHMDTVPAKEETCAYPPFSGHIADGKIYGRGTQDMKGVGVVHYFALKKIKDENIALKRTVHLVLVPDEEVGGAKGAKLFVETDLFKKLNIGFALDEALASGSKEILFMKVSERTLIHIEFVSRGQMGHGSRLLCKNPVNNLALFLSRLASFQEAQRARVAQEELAPGQLLSINITSLQAGVIDEHGNPSINVVPDCAVATADVRVPPTKQNSEAIAMLERELKDFPDISYTICAQAEDMPFNKEFKTPFYQAMESSIVECGLQATPYYAEFSTDLRFYLQKGAEGIGLSPFTIEPNLHGVDECVYTDDLVLGRDIFFSFLKRFCV